MKFRYLVFALAALTSCAASEESKSKAATAAPIEPVSAPSLSDAAPATRASTLAVPSIASAQLSQDCPDPKSELAAPSATPGAAKEKRKRDSADGEWVQPCSQSSVQLAFAGQGAKSAKVQLKQVRLLSAEGDELAILTARMPTVWKESVFVAWNGVLPANEDQEVSYKLSVPDWTAVEKASGSSSFGQMFVLEVAVEIEGRATTLRSPQFERSRPEIIKT